MKRWLGRLGIIVVLGLLGFTGMAHTHAEALDSTGYGLLYSTYLGGSGDDKVNDVVLGTDGSIYVTGYTGSNGFGSGSNTGGSLDVFVAKLAPDGRTLSYLEIFGGDGEDVGNAIAIDALGNVYVTGYTHSSNFPTTTNAFDPTFNGGAEAYQEVDAFVVKLDTTGTLVYSTYLGGSGVSVPGQGRMGGSDIGVDLAFDDDYVYVTGLTESDDFPTTGGAYDRTYADIDYGLTRDLFIVKLHPAAQGSSDLIYGTYVGGGLSSEMGRGIAVAGDGTVYVTGHVSGDSLGEFPLTGGAIDTVPPVGIDTDAILLKLNPAGGSAQDLIYATLLGTDQGDVGHAVAVDAMGTAYVTGETGSPDFPTTAGAFDTACGTDGTCNYISGFGPYADAFFVRIRPNPSGTAQANLLYGTFLGGSDFENTFGEGDLALIGGGEVFLTGDSRSPDSFPTTADAFSSERTGIHADVFVVRLRPEGNGVDDLVYGSYLGGSDVDGPTGLAWNGGDIVTVAGHSWETSLAGDFPTTPDALYPAHSGGGQYHYDGFLFRLQAPPPKPDLRSSQKKVTPDQAVVGEVVTYTVRLANSGTLTATAMLTDVLPSTLSIKGTPVASAGSAPAVNGQTITWSGPLTIGASVTLTYTAELTSTATLTPAVVNTVAIGDGFGTYLERSAYLNGWRVSLPLVMRSW